MQEDKEISKVKIKKSSGRMYLVEYFFKHVSLAWLVSSMAYAVSLVVLSWFDEVSDRGSAVIGFSAFFITSLLIFLPLSVWLHKRTIAEEALDSSLKDKGVRKFILFFFLFQYAAAAIVSTIVAATAIINNLLSAGAGARFDNDFWLLVAISASLAALFGFVTALVYKEDNRGKLSSIKIPFLIGLSILLTILLIAFPVRMNRGSFADEQKVVDLNDINYGIQKYLEDNREMPSSLDKLSLDDELEERLGDYEYTRLALQGSDGRYEICAEFNNDTTRDGPDYESDNYYGNSNSFWDHKAGKDCFKRTVYNYDYYPPNNRETEHVDIDYSEPAVESPAAVEVN